MPSTVTETIGGAQIISVSGNVVNVSGQPVSVSGDIIQISGQPVTVSGDIIQISGQGVLISGQSVITDSGSVTSVSGNAVLISGQIVNISGQDVFINSGSITSIMNLSGESLLVNISGATLTLASGTTVTVNVSGNIVEISGQKVFVLTASGDQVSVIAGNVIDSGNSTTTALGSSQIFSGVGILVLPYTQVLTEALTDASGMLITQFSPDNTNWDHTYTNFVSPNDTISIHTPVCAEFFKLIYRNGSLPQSFFRLQTMLKPIPSTGIIKDLDLVLTDRDDVLGTHSVITGKSTAGVLSGQYIDVKVDPSGAITVAGHVSVDSGNIIVLSGSVVSVSGNIVITGSGSATKLISGSIVSNSGVIITTASGSATLTVSGSITSVSGNIVLINSGLFVIISGQTVGITSGSFVSISGQAVVTDSGSVTSVSGNIVTILSGTAVATSVSGQYVAIDDISTVSQFYEVTPSLTLISGENFIVSAGIDVNKQLAYFNSWAPPAGKVIKIDLPTLTKVSTLLLSIGDPLATLIDTANQLAYFGAAFLSPSKVVKVDLESFTELSSITLAVGENDIRCGVMDITNNLAYFGLNTDPGKVVKIGLSSFTELSTITLNSGESFLFGAVIDTPKQFAYFGTQSGIIVKINLSTFTEASSLTLSSGGSIGPGIIDTLSGFAYFGLEESPSRVVKINLNTFTEASTLTFAAGENFIGRNAAVIDTNHQIAYFGTITSPGKAVKIDLDTFSRIGSITFLSGEESTESAVIDAVHGFIYFGQNTFPGIITKVAATFDSLSIPAVSVSGNIVQISGQVVDISGQYVAIDDISTVSQFYEVTPSINLLPGENILNNALVDSTRQLAYFATLTTPAKVIKVGLDTFTEVSTITLLSGEENVESAIIDTNNQLAYFGTRSGKIVKINLATFTEASTITLLSGESRLTAADIDTTNNLAYFCTTSGKVIKIDLSSFTRLSSLALTSGAIINVALVDIAKQLAYFGKQTNPGQFTKVDLSTLTELNTIVLTAGNQVDSGVIDTTNNFAYLGLAVGKAVKIDLTSFTELSSFVSGPGNALDTAVIDPINQFLYYGINNASPAQISKIDLKTFVQKNVIVLQTGENLVQGAGVIDITKGFLYFGTGTSPGKVVKVATTFQDPSIPAVTVSGNVITAITSISGNYVLIDDMSTFSRFYQVTPSTLLSGDSLGSAVLDARSQLVYLGGEAGAGTSGEIVKFNLANLTRMSSILLLSGETPNASAAVIDPDNQFAYFGTSPANSAKVIKVDLKSFTRSSSITLLSGEGSLQGAVIDTTNNLAYFEATTGNNSGLIIKINLSSLTEASTIILASGEVFAGPNSSGTGIIDIGRQLAYFGTNANPGKIVKIDLTTFTRASAITLASGDAFCKSALIDTDRQLAYFGMASGLIVKIDLNTFTRVSTLVLISGCQLLAAEIDTDHQIAYFGNGVTASVLSIVNLNTFKELPNIPLVTGLTNLGQGSVIDIANGFAYFATNDSDAARIVKIATTFDPLSIPAVTVSGNIVQVAGSQFVPFDQDPITKSFTDVGHPHDDIHEGNVYYVSDIATLRASGSFTQYVATTSSAFSHMLFNVITNAGVIVRLWENPTITSFGLPLTTRNRNRSSGLTTLTTVFRSGVITSGTGTLLDVESVGAGGGVGATSFIAGGTTAQDRNENEWVLRISGSYLLETFATVSGASLTSQFRWYDEAF